jgi:hypothetical protein
MAVGAGLEELVDVDSDEALAPAAVDKVLGARA